MTKIVSILLLICLFPIFVIVALAIIIDDGFPILFRQKRVGQNNAHFWIYKFRTMKKDIPEIPTHLLKDPQQFYTRSGPFIRKLSIDELPQLINIIKVDMVFVGSHSILDNKDDLVELPTRFGVQCRVPAGRR